MTIPPRPNGSAAGHVEPENVAPGDLEPARLEPSRLELGGADVGEGVPITDAAGVARARMRKAPSAFRTISEVADDLHIPQHVLRFWETKFPQVRPLKRGGGRRYYRPDDIALLRRISDLLYIQGFTIKGVQRLLREGGGRLSDDIPPPTGDERRDPNPGGGERELPIPGLLAQGDDSGTRGRRMVRSRGGDSGDRSGDDETARLRAVIAAALLELEALRTLLP